MKNLQFNLINAGWGEAGRGELGLKSLTHPHPTPWCGAKI